MSNSTTFTGIAFDQLDQHVKLYAGLGATKITIQKQPDGTYTLVAES